ncbi:hypothetical protein DSECCO2_539970 [anaerobic digester metagenome]
MDHVLSAWEIHQATEHRGKLCGWDIARTKVLKSSGSHPDIHRHLRQSTHKVVVESQAHDHPQSIAQVCRIIYTLIQRVHIEHVHGNSTQFISLTDGDHVHSFGLHCYVEMGTFIILGILISGEDHFGIDEGWTLRCG